MLSKHDRRRLAAIESQLSADEPALAEKLSAFDAGSTWDGEQWDAFARRHRVLTIGAIALLGSFSLLAATLALPGSAIVLAILAASGLALLRAPDNPQRTDGESEPPPDPV